MTFMRSLVAEHFVWNAFGLNRAATRYGVSISGSLPLSVVCSWEQAFYA
jgi:hypothetical protein